jgi:hypothetical protein
MAEWQKIFDTALPYRAEIVRAVLADKNIESVIINKRDSSYTVIGHYELLVPQEDVLLAIKILENEIHFE